MDDVKQLRQADNTPLQRTAFLYSVIGVSVGLGITAFEADFTLGILLLPLACCAIGWAQFALFNVLHEGLHNRFGNPHREGLAYLLAAYPVGFTDSYQQVHLDHHRYLGDPERDPDWISYANFPKSRRAFTRRFLYNLSGLAAVLQFMGKRQATPAAQNLTPGKRVSRLLLLVAMQLFILSLFWIAGGPQYYLLFWLLPIVTIGKLLGFTRTLCEHGDPEDRVTVRTITGGLLGEKILGFCNFHYHAEHHEYVYVPCQLLPEAHALCHTELFTEHTSETTASKGKDAVRYELYTKGYFSLLRQWYQTLPASNQ